MKIYMYAYTCAVIFFSHIYINSCPTCIGNLEDETTPAFFSNELYKAPQPTAQKSSKEIEDLLDSEVNEDDNNNELPGSE